MKLKERIQHAWNAFNSKPALTDHLHYGAGNGMPTHRSTRNYTTSSFAAAIFNRIALDVSMTQLHHVRIDEKTEDRTTIKSGLHYCLNTEANLDQTNLQFIQDMVYSMFDEGVVAIVPTDTTINPELTGSFEIDAMRVGRITQWFPEHVRIDLYNEGTGKNEEVMFKKKSVAILENPLYSVVNGPNATLTRLLRKMALIDNIDELVAAGRLDLIIQLPHGVKTDLQKKSAESRINMIEEQLKAGKHGITYIDSTEKITQLNRPANNQIIQNVEVLAQQFYNQLGLTANIFNGTASEAEMRGYYTRTIDPIVDNIIAEMNRKFLTKTARTQGHTLESYRDLFKFVPVEQIAQLGDTLRRNSIATANEIRQIVGFKVHNDPRSDELYNPNMADSKQKVDGPIGSPASPVEEVVPDRRHIPIQNE